MTMTRSKKRTPISADWLPDEAGREFAQANGVAAPEIARFRDYHLAHGTLMASWPAAWRTWCRNAVRFGNASGKPAAPPLVVAFDAADRYGANAWSGTLREFSLETVDGKVVRTIGGFDVVACARDFCEAAGIEESARPDLSLVESWLRDELDPDVILRVIQESRRPDRPSLRYYDGRVRERARWAA